MIHLQDLLEYPDLYSLNLAVHGMGVYNLLFYLLGDFRAIFLNLRARSVAVKKA